MSVVKQVLDIRRYQQYIKPHQQRIKADAGSLVRDDRAKEFFDVLKQIGIYDSCKLAISPDFGIKTRVSGSNTFVSKGYSLVQNNDATQTTSTSQPHLGNIIAPNERPSFKNQNGQSNYLTHPTISFGADQEWTVSTVVNWNGSSAVYSGVCGSSISSTKILIRSVSNNRIRVFGNTTDVSGISSKLDDKTGKQKIFSFVYKAPNVDFYIDGIFQQTLIINDLFTFNLIGKADSGESYLFNGSIPLHIIHSAALTPTQVSQLSNYLMSKYPEIPSVTIGSQVWQTSNCEMVATPQGNLIQNMTANANVEKITNAADREFSSDTGFWTKGTGWAIIDGAAASTNSFNSLRTAIGLISNKYYKITITIYRSSGYVYFYDFIDSPKISESGTYSFYLKKGSSSSAFYVTGFDFTGTVDNVSVQEVGWSDSTNLYDYIYANTSGTVEQKTYAGVKAAAMWCYYNNDSALGAIYGKLYNWYAVKLLQMDIDYYNAANPSTPWGWRVPSDTDFNTLATTLGGGSVAGGKMKKEGLVYWNSPNTGADNSSGFSVIGGGMRTSTFINFGGAIGLWTITPYVGLTLTSDSAGYYYLGQDDAYRGYNLRLIKS